MKEANDKDHLISGDSIYMKCPEEDNPETESRSAVARGWKSGVMVGE